MIWNTIDKKKAAIKPGIVLPEDVISNPLDFEDYFWYNLKEEIVGTTQKAKGDNGIIKPKLSPESFKKLLEFSIDRLVYIGIPKRKIDLLFKKFTSLSEQMRKISLMYDFKAATLLTPKIFIQYGNLPYPG